MSYILERFERWRWIHPLPSNPPRETCLTNEIRLTRRRRRKRRTYSGLSFQNHRKRNLTHLFPRINFIKQKNSKISKLKKCFQFTYVRKEPPKCHYKCLNSKRKNCFSNKTNCFPAFNFKKWLCGNVKLKDNGNEKLAKNDNTSKNKTNFNFLCSSGTYNLRRKTGKLFRVGKNLEFGGSSQTSTFNYNDINKSQFEPMFVDEQQTNHLNIDGVMLCKENLIFNNSNKKTIMENDKRPLFCGDNSCKKVNGYFFAQHKREYEIDNSVFTPLAWNRKMVIEEKYFDPRLCSTRLVVLNQETIHFK